MTVSSLFITLSIAAGAVALLVLGYSITYFFKGRHMQTEVGENDHMKAMEIKCTSQQIREEEARLRGVPLSEIDALCSDADCYTCSICETIEKSS